MLIPYSSELVGRDFEKKFTGVCLIYKNFFFIINFHVYIKFE